MPSRNQPGRSDEPATDRGGLRTVTLPWIRVLVDGIIIGLWVLFLTLIFLSAGWSGWLFYAALLLGVAGYVSVTAAWF